MAENTNGGDREEGVTEAAGSGSGPTPGAAATDPGANADPSAPDASAGPWTIGEMAERVGVATHVLRHWEDENLLHPERTSSGYRRYRLSDLIRILAIQHNQRAGMGLPEIRALLDLDNAYRHRILEDHLEKLDELAREIEHSRAMTEHALRCRNHDISSCPRFADIVGQVAESDGRALPPDFANFPVRPAESQGSASER